MTAPSPSPAPSPSSPPLPPQPDYHGAAAKAGQAAQASSSSNPNDIWGLAEAYGQPVYLGAASVPDVKIDPQTGRPLVGGDKTLSNQYGKTQDIIKQVINLWSQQKAERDKNPNQLTGYEALQQQLYAAGFYGQTSYDSIHVGQWSSQTQDALVNALQSYESSVGHNKIPMTFAEFLQQNSSQNGDGGFYSGSGAPGGGSSSSGPTQVNLTDPAAIRAAAQTAAQQALGRGLSETQLEQFVNQFQQTQQQVATSTAATVSSPSLSDQAMQFVQENDPHAYAQNKRQSYVNALIDMFAPSGSQRPGTTPVPSV